MRMWCVPTETMCRQHLLGEHLEVHMFASSLKANKPSLFGYIKNGLLQIDKIQKRHQELVDEMLRRGYQHKSPMGYLQVPSKYFVNMGHVSTEKNLKVLAKRCEECAGLQANTRSLKYNKRFAYEIGTIDKAIAPLIQ